MCKTSKTTSKEKRVFFIFALALLLVTSLFHANIQAPIIFALVLVPLVRNAKCVSKNISEGVSTRMFPRAITQGDITMSNIA